MDWGIGALAIQRIVWRYGVEIHGWPDNIAFQAPSRMKPADCSAILRAVRWERIKFDVVKPHIKRRYAAMLGSTVEAETEKVGRADKGEKWPLGRPEARTKKPAKKPVKTSRFVPSESDTTAK